MALRHQLDGRQHAAAQARRGLQHGVVAKPQLPERLRVVQVVARAHKAKLVGQAAEDVRLARFQRAHALLRVGLDGHRAAGERAHKKLHGRAGVLRHRNETLALADSGTRSDAGRGTRERKPPPERAPRCLLQRARARYEHGARGATRACAVRGGRQASHRGRRATR